MVGEYRYWFCLIIETCVLDSGGRIHMCSIKLEIEEPQKIRLDKGVPEAPGE